MYIFKLNSLVLCFFSYPAYVDTGTGLCIGQCVISDKIPECHKIDVPPKYLHFSHCLC